MEHRPYDDKTDGPWPEESTRWMNNPRVIVTDPGGGTHYGYLVDGVALPSVGKTPSAADEARWAATAAKKATEATEEARRAALLAKAKARTLTAGELQEALEKALGG